MLLQKDETTLYEWIQLEEDLLHENTNTITNWRDKNLHT